MQKSTVYFADFRSSDSENLQQKFARLLKTAGLAKIGLDGKYVAVKTHFGEPGCLAYLRPNWAKTLADSIRNAGGLPFLTDANTLYVGRRKNALDSASTRSTTSPSPTRTASRPSPRDAMSLSPTASRARTTWPCPFPTAST